MQKLPTPSQSHHPSSVYWRNSKVSYINHASSKYYCTDHLNSFSFSSEKIIIFQAASQVMSSFAHFSLSSLLCFSSLGFLYYFRRAIFEFDFKMHQTAVCEIVLIICCVILWVNKFCFIANLKICQLSWADNLLFLSDLLYFSKNLFYLKYYE